MSTDWAALEQEARAFAAEKHAAQRYGDRPYVVHLAAVRAVLAEFGYGEALAVAAWLHDVVEDTEATREDIAARFGDEVAQLVWAVTGVGPNRRARNASAYEKIRAYPRAAILKLADRTANAEASREAPDKLAMYRAEHPAFTRALEGTGDERMWARLAAALAGAHAGL